MTYFEIRDLRLGSVGDQVFEEKDPLNPDPNLEP
jgi:hypothetical protein